MSAVNSLRLTSVHRAVLMQNNLCFSEIYAEVLNFKGWDVYNLLLNSLGGRKKGKKGGGMGGGNGGRKEEREEGREG